MEFISLSLGILLLFGPFADKVYAEEELALSIAPPSVIFELLALNRDLPTPVKPKYRSPTDLVASPDGKKIYICEQTAKRIAVFDVASGAVEKRILLPNEVTGCAVAPEEATLYATCSSDLWPNGLVCVVDIASGRVRSRIAVGHGARAPVISPDGEKLFVCNQFDDEVSEIDLAAQQEIRRIEVVREPYCAAITPDGETLVVGNLLPVEFSIDSMRAWSKISLIDVAKGTVAANIRLRRGSSSVLGCTVSPDGKYAFATHLISRFDHMASTVEKGWLHTNNLAIIDIAEKRLINEICLDDELQGAGNPWEVGCTDDGEFLVVAHAGSNELSNINLPKMLDSVVAKTADGMDMQKDFIALADSRTRVQVTTKGPRALAIIGDRVYTAGYFDDSSAAMEEFEISLETTRPFASYIIGESRHWAGARKGESCFYTASLCEQSWMSCHSCHPFTRADGLVWMFEGGAVIAPKNTISLLHSWWTPPNRLTGHITGATYQKGVAAYIIAALRGIENKDLTNAIDTLFMHLKPVASPFLENGRLSEAAQRGKAIYCNVEKVDCEKCHPLPLTTDCQFWNTGVPDPFDANTQWETPHLIEAWRTGPYNHIGSMTLQEICELPGHSNASANLTPEEMDDLVAYVLSL